MIKVIFQDYAHYFLTAWENVWIGDVKREPSRDQIAATAELTGAAVLAKGVRIHPR